MYRDIGLALVLALCLVGCPAPGDDDDDDGCNVDESWPLDFEAICGGEWPSDECTDGDCGGPDVEQRYHDEFIAHFQDVAGLTDEAMECHVRARSVNTHEAQQSSYTDVWFQIEVDWVRLVDWWGVGADGGDPTAEEIAAEWDTWGAVPRVDPGADLLRYEDVQGFIDDCAAQHGVTLDPVGWCDGWIADHANDDADDAQMHFRFSAPMPGDPSTEVEATVYPLGDEAHRCRTNQVGGDEP
jgi:hypothetical protein